MSASDASSLSLWSILSNVGFVFVIVGVIAEGIEAYFWTIGWLRRKQLQAIWIKLPEPHVPRWAHRLDHIGWFILVVGLVLEFWGHIRVSDITDREGRRLSKELTVAVYNLGVATNAAAQANLLVAKIGTTNTQLIVSNTTVALQVEQLRKANDLLESQLYRRFLEPNEIDALVAQLRVFAGINVKIIFSPTRDCGGIAWQINGVLARAGWKTNDLISTVKRVPAGVLIGKIGSPTNIAESAMAALDEGLNQADVESKMTFNISPMTSLRFDGILIFIGERPLGLENQIFLQQNVVSKAEFEVHDLTRQLNEANDKQGQYSAQYNSDPSELNQAKLGDILFEIRRLNHEVRVAGMRVGDAEVGLIELVKKRDNRAKRFKIIFDPARIGIISEEDKVMLP